MRPIDTLILHCSATPPDMDIGVAEIDTWHKAQGWKRIGYHFVIRRNGIVERGRPLAQIGAHVEGHNRRTTTSRRPSGRHCARWSWTCWAASRRPA